VVEAAEKADTLMRMSQAAENAAAAIIDECDDAKAREIASSVDELLSEGDHMAVDVVIALVDRIVAFYSEQGADPVLTSIMIGKLVRWGMWGYAQKKETMQ
jgi:hypothetical protein